MHSRLFAGCRSSSWQFQAGASHTNCQETGTLHHKRSLVLDNFKPVNAVQIHITTCYQPEGVLSAAADLHHHCSPVFDEHCFVCFVYCYSEIRPSDWCSSVTFVQNWLTAVDLRLFACSLDVGCVRLLAVSRDLDPFIQSRSDPPTKIAFFC